MACNPQNPGPQLTIERGEGTTPCPDPPSTTPVVCPIDACCNYFKLLVEAEGQSFILSAGGPFQVEDPDCERGIEDPFNCPPDGDPLFYLQPHVNYGDPGPLSAIICPDLTPGTYKVCARYTLRDGEIGARAVAIFRPDCEDADDEICLADCSVACPSEAEMTDYPEQPLRDLTCYDCLYVVIGECRPGIRFLARQGCRLTGQIGLNIATIENLQLTITRISSRDLVDCGGSPLVRCEDMPGCGDGGEGPILLSTDPIEGGQIQLGLHDIVFTYEDDDTLILDSIVIEGWDEVDCDGDSGGVFTDVTSTLVDGVLTITVPDNGNNNAIVLANDSTSCTVRMRNACGSDAHTLCFGFILPE